MIDASDVHAFADTLRAAPPRVMAAVVPVAERAGANVKRVMRKDASGHRYLRRLPQYVEYDVESGPMQVSVAIGFRKEGVGNLAAIAAFGTPSSAPVMDITRGLSDEAPRFATWLAKVGAEAL